MGNTLYASFPDPAHAEKAAGALLDHGVRPEDLSVVRSHDGRAETTNYGTSTTTSMGRSDVSDREGLIGGIAGGSGLDSGQLIDQAARREGDATRADLDSAAERPAGTTNYAGNYPNDVNTPSATVSSTSRDTDLGSHRGDADHHPDVVDTSGDVEAAAKHGISTTTAADAGAGAIKGTVVGAGIGVLAALASLVVPGVGLVLGGGALAAGLGAVAASAGAGALSGAVTGYLKDQGVDEHAAHAYHETVAGGGALLAVSLPSGDVQEAEARGILEKYGASNLNSYVPRGYMS